MGVRFCNDNTAAVIASTIEPDSTIIAHSNGAALVHEAAELGARFSHVILINPALDKHLEIENAKRTTVYYAPSDPWTKLAAFIPFSNWGNMGAKGYRPRSGICPRNTVNINLDRLTGLECGHSGVFATPLTRGALVKSITHQMERET